MALGTPTLLGGLVDGVDRNAYTITGLTTPIANADVFVAILNTKAALPDEVFSVSGCNLTWSACPATSTVTWDVALKRVTWWKGKGASPSGTSVTVDFNGVTQTGFIGAVIQITGADITTPVVQATTNSALAATSLDLTLSGLLSTSIHLAAYGVDGNTDILVESGATELYDDNIGAPTARMAVHYRLGESVLTANTGAISRDWGGVGIEVQEPVAAGGVPYPRLERWIRGLERWLAGVQ